MTEMMQAGVVIIAIVVFLGFMAYADKQTDKDEEERRRRDEE